MKIEFKRSLVNFIGHFNIQNITDAQRKIHDCSKSKVGCIIFNPDIPNLIYKFGSGSKTEGKDLLLDSSSDESKFIPKFLIDKINKSFSTISIKDRCAGVFMNDSIYVLDDNLMNDTNYDLFVNIIRKINLKDHITYGMDTEFEVMRDNKYVSASTLFSNEMEEEMGYDGMSFISEMRPRFSSKIEEVVDNSKEIIKKVASKYSDVKLLSGGGEVNPTGCHIHLGGIYPTADFINVMDHFVGHPLRSMRGGERPTNEYGALGDFRDKNANLQCHWEYRTPPSFLATPFITMVVFSMVKMLIDGAIYKDIVEISETRIRIPTDSDFDQIVKNEKDIGIVRDYINILKNKTLREDVIQTWLN